MLKPKSGREDRGRDWVLVGAWPPTSSTLQAGQGPGLGVLPLVTQTSICSLTPGQGNPLQWGAQKRMRLITPPRCLLCGYEPWPWTRQLAMRSEGLMLTSHVSADSRGPDPGRAPTQLPLVPSALSSQLADRHKSYLISFTEWSSVSKDCCAKAL